IEESSDASRHATQNILAHLQRRRAGRTTNQNRHDAPGGGRAHRSWKSAGWKSSERCDALARSPSKSLTEEEKQPAAEAHEPHDDHTPEARRADKRGHVPGRAHHRHAGPESESPSPGKPVELSAQYRRHRSREEAPDLERVAQLLRHPIRDVWGLCVFGTP